MVAAYWGQGLEPLVNALPVLLPLYWVLCAGAAMASLIPWHRMDPFRSAVVLSACRGKLLDGQTKPSLGPLSGWTVPQKWFAHFYALGVIWNSLVLLAFRAVQRRHVVNAEASQLATLALAALQVHLARRLLETVLLLRYPPQARMHGVAYAFSMTYYIVVPLSLLPEGTYVETWRALARGVGSGALVSRAGLGALSGDLAATWRGAPVLLRFGLAVFAAGNLLQLWSHAILARLAAKSRRGGATYRIPRSGPFRLVSSPHYLGEVVVYLGLALLTGPRIVPWLMLAWVGANLTLAAGLTHQWYRRTFRTYPRRRKALVPWLY